MNGISYGFSSNFVQKEETGEKLSWKEGGVD